MTRVGDELRRAVADLFLMAAEAVGQRLRSASLGPTVPFPGSVVERGSTGVGHWSTSVQIQSINVLRIPQVAARIAPWLSETELAQVRQRAAELADSAQETLPFWVVFSGRPLPVFTTAQNINEIPPPDYSSDPAGWVARFILLPALQHHLTALPSVTDADEATASSFADDVLKVAHDDRVRYRLVVPLNGLALEPSDGQFTAQGVSIRAVSDRERGEWLDERGGISMAFLQSGEFAPPEVAIEFKESSQRNASLENNPGPVPSLVGALQLHGHWVAGRLYRVQSDPPWVVPTLQQLPLTVPGIVEGRSVLTAEGFAIALATAKLLAGYGITQPRSPKDLALHRFFAGVARSGARDFLPGEADRNAADAVLDFTIALEALLLPYDENARHGDLSYRFRMHGAHYLADDPAQRATLARKLSGIYEMRSRLVHGGKYPALGEIKTARDEARELARRGLLRAVQKGFPTAAAFNQMILGTE
jgi:hypothetical protein